MGQINTDLADKVLAANVRNIIQKVQDGGRLTASEIKIFEQYTLEQTELHKTRQSALIRKWVGGGRLTEDEKQEIADIVPIPETNKATHTRQAFQKEQKEYAAIYEQSDRTIKRWIAKGRLENDLPPLDSPSQMPAWWPRHYKHKVPEGILNAAKKTDSLPAPMELSPSISSPTSDGEGIEIGRGFSEMLERVKEAEAEASREYLSAVKKNPDDARIPALRKTWNEFSKQLRELERDSHEILSRSGALIEKSAIEKIIAEIHAPIVNGIRSLWRRVKNRMQAASDAQQDRIWQDEVDRLLSRLNESAFTAHE